MIGYGIIFTKNDGDTDQGTSRYPYAMIFVNITLYSITFETKNVFNYHSVFNTCLKNFLNIYLHVYYLTENVQTLRLFTAFRYYTCS